MTKLIDIEAVHSTPISENMGKKKRQMKHESKNEHEQQIAVRSQDSWFQSTIRNFIKNRRLLTGLYNSFLETYNLKNRNRQALNE
jgi:hypothetical protein